MRRTWTARAPKRTRTTPDVTPHTAVGLWLWITICLVARVAAATAPTALDIAPRFRLIAIAIAFTRRATDRLNREGNDGPWSTFPILVGSPAQDTRVLISTASTSTWVVAVQGCQGSDIPSNCSTTRGAPFNISTSTSWQDNGPWGLNIESNLGTDYAADEGQFGWDTVGLGFQGSGGPMLNHTVVAGLQTMDYYIGMLGLNPRPTNFSDFNHPQPSYLSLLYEDSKIPSLSYSYTAGAQYRFNKVLGSLTLGGYDDSLFAPNNVTFPFYYDQSRDLTVGLKSITGSGGESLLPTGILTLIDTTVSQMWLPLEACTAFESTFGLVYDKTTDLYLVNDTQHAALQKQNTSLTFTLAPTLADTTSIDITFPYAAFDLEVSYPLVNTTQRYFPLHRAANDTQYTLGRVFLQEAYLTVDYGRSNFSVSQRKWELNPSTHMVDILPQNATDSSGNGNGTSTAPVPDVPAKTKTSIGAIVGGIIAGLAAMAALAFSIRFLLRRRRRTKSMDLAQAMQREQEHPVLANATASANESGMHEHPDAALYKHELDTPGEKTPEMHGSDHYGNVEMSAEELMAELAAREERGTMGLCELEAPCEVVELSGEERGWDMNGKKRVDGEGLLSQAQAQQQQQQQQRNLMRGVDTAASVDGPRPFSWQ
ncbi:hypothetical protein LOCC1_G003815 [Lachnellula occidentalis]|uniref:Peptidase A1 domain-containing protein n=1 Tax=Lachnellula occidentalis TaxID=215460 RepID=A0A8H8UJ69_9HELO|nr:hypothetical protein LOCC1_G003815 [Lachnellula occidentalis]